jgi:hypothetical protein
MRLYRISRAQVAAIIIGGADDGYDSRGNRCLVGTVDGRRIRVILARDAPNTVITVYETRS